MTDPKDLKIAALREALAANISTYEDRIADLRVALTQKEEELREALTANPVEEINAVPWEPAEENDE